MRLPVLALLGLSVVGLLALAVFPPAAIALAAILLLAGAVAGARGDRVSGFGLAATGVTLLVAAVLVLAFVDARQDEPVIIGPDRGLTPVRP